MNGRGIATKPWCHRTQRDARDEVADDGGQTEPAGDQAADEGIGQPDREIDEQRQLGHAALSNATIRNRPSSYTIDPSLPRRICVNYKLPALAVLAAIGLIAPSRLGAQSDLDALM